MAGPALAPIVVPIVLSVGLSALTGYGGHVLGRQSEQRQWARDRRYEECYRVVEIMREVLANLERFPNASAGDLNSLSVRIEALRGDAELRSSALLLLGPKALRRPMIGLVASIAIALEVWELAAMNVPDWQLRLEAAHQGCDDSLREFLDEARAVLDP